MIVLATIFLALQGITYIGYAYTWHTEMLPLIREKWNASAFSAVPFQLPVEIVFSNSVYMPILGIGAILCLAGFVFLKNWARKLFIFWSLAQIFFIYWSTWLQRCYAAQSREHFNRAQEMGSSSAEQGIQQLNQMGELQFLDPWMLLNTALLLFLIYYFTRHNIRNQFQ